MRHRLVLAVCAYLLIAGSAAAHTSVGGGSSGPEDPNADCLRWETVPLTVDAAVPDAAADAGRADAGSSGVTVLRCAEHATMFGCACALEQPRRGGEGAAAVVLAALVTGTRRRRRTDRRGSGR